MNEQSYGRRFSPQMINIHHGFKTILDFKILFFVKLTTFIKKKVNDIFKAPSFPLQKVIKKQYILETPSVKRLKKYFKKKHLTAMIIIILSIHHHFSHILQPFTKDYDFFFGNANDCFQGLVARSFPLSPIHGFGTHIRIHTDQRSFCIIVG